MSRFAALRDDYGDNGSDEYAESSDALERLTPQYSKEEILNLYKTFPAPPSISKFPNIFMAEPQLPECNNPPPQKSEINSTIYLNLNGKGQNRRNNRTSQRGGNNNSGRGKNNQNDKRSDFQPHSTANQEEPEENLNQLWYYKDPLDCIVGPYSSRQMQEWLEKRYIDTSLCVRNAASEASFQPIGVIFQDISKAFAETNNQKTSGSNTSDNSQEKRITTLFSFYNDDANEEWEHDDQKI